MPSKTHAWRLAALTLLALLAYSNSFQGGMVFDNSTAILKDSRVHAWNDQNVHLILNEEYWYNSTTTGLYRPLTTFSYLFNYAVMGNGPNPAGYHWFNFLLHIANLLLVYWLGLVILEDATWALALAALWGLHPLLTESVANIVGRADLMAAFGVLAGLVCHIGAAAAQGRRKWTWLAGLAIAAGIGIFSKEAAAVLPAVMLLYDLTWPQRASWSQRIPGYIAMALPFAIFFEFRADLQARLPVGLIPYADNPLFGYDFWTAKLTAVKIVGKFIGLFFLPLHQSADYSYNSIAPGGWTDPATLASLAVCLGAVALLVLSYRRAKPLFFFLAFFFGTLAPTSNLLLLIGSVMAERFVYLPSVGLAGCVAWGLRELARRLPNPRVVWAAAGLVCLALAGATYARNPVWHDDVSLWTSVAQAYPQNFKAHTTLAEQYAAAGQLDRAAAEADRSLEILGGLPDNHSTPRPYATAALCYRLKGDYPKALAALQHGRKVEALEIEQIQQVNLEHGKRVKAAGWMPLYLELGRTYIALKQPEKAMEPLAYGRSHSGDPEFVVETARAWQAEGNWERAAMVLIEAIEDGNSSPLLPAALVNVYRQSAGSGCAVRQTGTSVAIDMTCPLVHGHLCAASQELTAAYRQAGQGQRAAALALAAAQNFGCQ
ncbi:MAG TPA: glycosyltransferase family 39 protein [Candidatus Sulfopaludibacter sp.]|nr:glycosyltransferase family 39 protein [Candidatus Sulfopaludibacter sp.]